MRRFFLLLLICLPLAGFAQQHDNSKLRQGNKCFRDSSYNDAVTYYKKAVSQDDMYAVPHYNLGCAYLHQRGTNADSVAMRSFDAASKYETDKKFKSMSFHNMGVICQKRQELQKAIEYYKQALRNNPSDDEARYNLVLCQRQLKNDQNQQNQNQNQDQQNQQQNQDQQQQQNQQNQQDQQDQNQQQDQQDQQQNQQQQQQMSKENAEKLLNAAMQNEKDTREKMDARQARQQRRYLQKQW